MKRLVFLTLLCLGITSINVHSQDLKSGKNTIIKVEYIGGTFLLGHLDKYEPATSREKKTYAKIQENLNIDWQNLLYNEVMEAFKESAIKTEPINALENHKVLYSNGFPTILMAKSAIKKTVKNGYKSDNFIILRLETEADTGLKGASSSIVNKFTPVVKATIDVYSSDGKKVNSAEHKVSSPEKYRTGPILEIGLTNLMTI